MKPSVRIENWSFQQTGDAYTAPELRSRCLVGTVYGHPRMKDGSEIQTSEIVKINKKLRRVFTVNTAYSLGTVDPKYEAWARENGIALL